MSPRRNEPRRLKKPSLGFLNGTAEAAFASDERNRIIVWNRAAADLIGCEPAGAIGQRCFEVVRGVDLFGNRFCSDSCPLRKMVKRHEPIHAFQMDVPTASGRIKRVDCSVVVAPGPRTGGHSLVHVLRPVAGEEKGVVARNAGPTSGERPGEMEDRGRERSGGRPEPLTRRETEVLRLLATGNSTAEIAEALAIGQVTVRNHIQHLLGKLEAHSKLQAICIARRHRLI